MSLLPDPRQLGHWLAPDRMAGQPGLFAVVIGVSSYPHLAGGDQPASENFDLGQLQVSALTAFRFFQWLQEGYLVEGCPLVEAWCLLAPSAAELKLEPGLATHACLPTFVNCKKAIVSWHAVMSRLGGAAAGSRAVFFFSGHGIEVFQREQVLLPCDWLEPPGELVNDALSTFNLLDGLSSLGVPQQFFFVDACRNDNQALRKRRVSGAPLLNEPAAADTNPDIVAPVLYATAGGLQAYQHADPKTGLSLYGTALLGGLKAELGLELRTIDGRSAVTLFPLQSYVSSRVAAAIAASREPVRQVVKLAGTVDDRIVTQLPAGTVPPPQFSPPLGTIARGTGNFVGSALAPVGAQTYTLDALLDQQWRDSISNGHALFGSETITALWQAATLQRLSDGTMLPLDRLELRSVLRGDNTSRVAIDVRINAHDALGVLLELHDSDGYKALVLQTRPNRPVVYSVEMDSDRVPGGGRLIHHLEARVASDGASIDRSIQRLWDAYSLQDAGRAERELNAAGDLPERIRRDRSPMGLALLALIDLRAPGGRWVHDALWDADGLVSPDLAVAAGERRLRRDTSAATLAAVAESWCEVLGNGLPLMSECFGLAATRLRHWVRRLDDLPQALHDDITALQALMTEALVDVRTDGLFVSYAGYETSGAPAFRRIPRELFATA